jgi:hypothetical protein
VGPFARGVLALPYGDATFDTSARIKDSRRH